MPSDACQGTNVPASARVSAKVRKGVSNLISDAAREAKLEARTAHGLRTARLTRIAEAGGSAHAIKSWGGHKTLAEAAHYTQSADAKRLVTGTEQEQNSVSLAERDTKIGNN
ncbi:tyrosine-type recombinase/integrase [Paracoccus kondratievae]|uniref:tyrosine-type recombinase/integrase n=1 Tax=Paracoccus kondratievae TaxID=135740 RepID=UPI0012666B4F|nr:tyrosine-type recombinase/integrase [Paracoccus kondratievae]QFQ88640.1 tyrosine-type recombinase/integrase [Paracoccus kondratievae]